jgi:YjbE family integral membrane protein
MEFLPLPLLIAFIQVVLIDIALAADNAVVVGMAAAGLHGPDRSKAIVIGIAAATILRIAFASVAVQIMQVTGLILAGGLLLLWVSWKMWRDMRQSHSDAQAALAGGGAPQVAVKTLRAAVVQIIVADVSMSLDNVLAVAGAAHDHPMAVVFGLMLSVVLMGVAATAIARLLDRYRWIGTLGLLVVLFVALKMIWEGSEQVLGGAWPF